MKSKEALMRKMNLQILALVAMIAGLPTLAAPLPQESAELLKEAQTKETAVYRVEYTVREFEDGKKLNSRTYAMMLSEDPRRALASGRIRVGSRVPTGRYEGGDYKGGVMYTDVGINIDCHLGEREKGVGLTTNFESSYLPGGVEAASTVPNAPIIRQVRLGADSLVTLDRPTVIGTVDDVITNRRYEIEVTVTKVE